ncbi:hypothetical protein N7490_002803 [Penicillium lividum]|nr:hypothetical protein N7490_002803 [Penicillium lividum]
MSGPHSTSTSTQNGTSSTLTQGNVSQVPRATRSSVDRFAHAPASETPYYAGGQLRNDRLISLDWQTKSMPWMRS